MKKITDNYMEKVYAGVLGKAIGVRLGAPVEPQFWSHDTIKNVYGDIKGYVKDYTNFAADDDTNGPIFFIRAMIDYAGKGEVTAEDIGNTWLNYTAEGHGMFWWGGYGISTEHTAYLNLKHGIKAPASGSVMQNGATLAEQIGGQIFIDSWGLICPGNPRKAAEYAEKAASVSHDRNGIYGGVFNAACIAKAFTTDNMLEVVESGLAEIPEDSEFMRVNKAVIEFFSENHEDFRACYKMLEDNFGYDRYRGICHMIPNAGVVTLSLLYGQGSVSRTVEIATMCGWDTDCNAGNVGTIAGVAYGLEGVEAHYRSPINDCLVASSVCGSLNIVDIPAFARSLVKMGYKVAEQSLPEYLSDKLDKKDIYYDFALAGSTHGFRLRSNRKSNYIKNIEDSTATVSRCLAVVMNDHRRGDNVQVYFKPFYRRCDFDDERYLPMFSPQVYAGQTIKIRSRLQTYSGKELLLSFYVRLTHSQQEIISETKIISDSEWFEMEWQIPENIGEAVDEVGIKLEYADKTTFVGEFCMDYLHLFGKGRQIIDFSKEKEEFNVVTQFSYNRGKWTLEDGVMQALSIEDAEAFTGNYYCSDYSLRALICPQNGVSHNLAFRCKGLMMGYYVGFSGNNKVVLIKNDHGKKIIAQADFVWQHGMEYEFMVIVKRNHFVISIDGKEIFNYEDGENNYFEHGMYGFALLDVGRCHFRSLEMCEL